MYVMHIKVNNAYHDKVYDVFYATWRSTMYIMFLKVDIVSEGMYDMFASKSQQCMYVLYASEGR